MENSEVSVNEEKSKDNSRINECTKVYSSSSIFMEIAENEFNREDERANKLHTKAGILLSVIVVLFTFYLPTMKIKEIIDFPASTFSEWMPLFVLLVIYIATSLFVFLSLLYLVLVIYTTSYERLDYNDFCKDSNLCAPEDIVQVAFTKKYCEMMERNSKSNDKKVKYYRKGNIYLLLALFCIVFTTFYSAFII